MESTTDGTSNASQACCEKFPPMLENSFSRGDERDPVDPFHEGLLDAEQVLRTVK
jgi:hypothetical protein